MSHPTLPDDDFMQDLLQRASRLLAARGVTADKADLVAEELCSEVRSEWGGQQLYIRKASPEEMAQRDLQIYNEFNGHNHLQLSRKYSLTTARIYDIVKRGRALDRARRQRNLFEPRQ